jgi:hypothetical protein
MEKDSKVYEIGENEYLNRTYRRPTGCGNIYIHIAFEPNEKKIAFIRISGTGGEADCGNSFCESLADMTTFAITHIRTYDSEMKQIIKNLRGHICNKKIPNRFHLTSCSDALGEVLEEIYKDDPIPK